MKIFVICPVRSGNLYQEVKTHVEELEKQGHTVHWPCRDTNQDDPTGFNISLQNRKAISEADEIHVAWDGQSQGCLFDLGMAFAFKKRIRHIEGLFPMWSQEKSYQNIVYVWEKVGPAEIKE